MAYFSSDLKDPKVGPGKTVVLGLQHTFTMFGATILVPLLTGLSITVALFMAGVGTLFFHLVTKGKMPVFLGSSFAFIAPIVAATAAFGRQAALGGIVVSGAIYVLLAVVVYFVGVRRVISFFPPVVTGPVIMVIGLNLAGTAVTNASGNWWLALMAFSIVVVVNIFFKGFAKSLPVLIGLVVSYAVALILTLCGVTMANPAAATYAANAATLQGLGMDADGIAALLGAAPALRAPIVDFSVITSKAWFGLPDFTLATFNLSAIAMVAPVAICTVVEHIGDVIAVGAICKRDFISDPGLHRSLIGDGIASSLSAMFGGPANTTYSENTGVLALTRAFNPAIMRIAACFAILLGFFPKLGGVIQSIPSPVIGGISIVLFGMIAAVGVRTVVENKVDFHAPRNLIIAAVILVLGIGNAVVSFPGNISIYGMALAAIIGIILNKLLPGAQSYTTGGAGEGAEASKPEAPVVIVEETVVVEIERD